MCNLSFIVMHYISLILPIAAIGIAVLLILMIIILSLLIIYQLRRNRQRKVWETERDHGTLRRSNSFQSQPTNE